MINLKDALIALVNTIPPGRVASYGQLAPILAEQTNKTITAQIVGWQLSRMPKHERPLLPRRRVVNKQGYISAMKLWTKWRKQRQLLEAEGLEIINDTVQDLDEVRWEFEGGGE